MIWLAVCLIIVGALVVFAALRRRPVETPVDPEVMLRAAVELHRVGRRLDVAYTKVEQRRDTSRLRREIREALESGDAL